jgi:hypothetical protein
VPEERSKPILGYVLAVGGVCLAALSLLNRDSFLGGDGPGTIPDQFLGHRITAGDAMAAIFAIGFLVLAVAGIVMIFRGQRPGLKRK